MRRVWGRAPAGTPPSMAAHDPGDIPGNDDDHGDRPRTDVDDHIGIDLDTGAPDIAVSRRVVIRRRTATAMRAAAALIGVGAIVFLWLDDHYGWLDYRPGGTAFFTYVRPIAYVLVIMGGLLAIKWEIVGAVVGAFAATAIGAFAVNQLIGVHAALVIALLAVPALLWLVADALDWSRHQVVAGVTTVAVAAAIGAGAGEYVYESFYGPTHPESETEALEPSLVRWVWSGGVTSDRARVQTRLEDDDARARLFVTETGRWDDATIVEPDERDGPLVGFTATGLRADTDHHYAVEVDGDLDLVRTGRFHTFPTGPASFTFTVGACARVGSNGAVFDAIRAEDPLFHLIAGDFHYGDIPDNERERYDEVLDLTLRQPAQAALYRSTPIAYIWDDHDYGVNDATASSASRLAALSAYRANVPSYDLAGDESPIYQRFDVGRVRFLLTDARSGRVPGETMLGGEQLAWFLDELVRAADEQAFVIWLNPVPWVAEASQDADDWGGFADERRAIADTIAANDIDQLLMVSGDAHMVAIDDGSNTDYAADGGAAFPLLHAAALDRPGSTKGGPYSHGELAGSGQYGVVHVVDDGATITVELRAKRYDGEVLLSYEFEVGSAG